MRSLVREIIYRSVNKLKFLTNYLFTWFGGILKQSSFKRIEHFCLFVGYGRSGHTLIASLLNAHPDIVIGIEWDPLDKVRLGYVSRNQIFYAILLNAINFTKKHKDIWSGYSYRVGNNWQGSYREIKVIGDKSGGLNTKQLTENFGLLDRIAGIVRAEVKLIHVIRNPFDIITTTLIRTFERDFPGIQPATQDLLPFIKKFLKSAKVIQRLKCENKYPMFDLYHEDFVIFPKEKLAALIEFLGETPDRNYLESCTEIVFQEPHLSRLRIAWDQDLIRYVEKELKRFSFLARYTYDNGS
jgi:hypothetical protein